MEDYKGLVKSLRWLANMFPEMLPAEDDTDRMFNNIHLYCRSAADAIEELSKKRVGTWHRVKASQRSYSFVCNSCGFMYPYLTRCCPNCGVEYIDEEPPKEKT